MTDCVIIDACRTPFAKSDGVYKKLTAVDLGIRTATALMERVPLNPDQLDGIIAGNVGSPCDAANIARVMGLFAGFPEALPAHTVARNCASGIEAVTTAVEKIRAGSGDVYLAITTESMTQYPLIMGPQLTAFFKKLGKARSPMAKLKLISTFRPSFLKPRIALLEGLKDPTNEMLMGSTADLIARDYDITREEQDAYALRSHQLGAAAVSEGRFAEEIDPFVITSRRGETVIDTDDHIRPETTIEGLAKLRAAFGKDGTVTAGNASGIVDGAAAVIVTTADRAKADSLDVMARIKSWAYVGVDPTEMGIGPVPAIRSCLERAGVAIGDVDYFEINEAFSAQYLGCEKDLGLDRDKCNVNGGAISLGHPLGATGTRLILTLMYQLRRSGKRYGVGSACIGGGQGIAMLIENPQA